MAYVVSHDERVPFGPQSALVFLHIPKCGGLTLLEVLKSNFASYWEFYAEHRWWRSIQDLNTAPRPLAITGHRIWGIHEPLSEDIAVFYYTMLRHPLAWLKSYYVYQNKRNQVVPHVSEFLISAPANRLVQWVGNNSLELAKERLAGMFHLYGLVEYYDLSAEVLTRTYGLSLNGAAMRNVTDSATLECPPSVIDYFLEKNAADLELYEWAKALFLQRHAPSPGHEQPAGSSLIQRTSDSDIEEPDIAVAQIKGEEYNEAIARILPQLPTGRRQVFDTLLDLYRLTGRSRELAELLPQAIERFPGLILQYLNKFHRYLDDETLTGLLQPELALAEQYVGTLPDSRVRVFLVEAALISVRRLWAAGALSEALQECYQVYKRFGDDVRVLRALCRLLLHTNTPAEALEALAYNPILLSDHSARPSLELLKADAYALLGQKTQTQAHLRSHQSASPDFHPILPVERLASVTSVISREDHVLLVGGEQIPLAHLLQAVATRAGYVDLLLPAHLCRSMPETKQAAHAFVLPDLYVHALDRSRLDSQLFARTYDVLIVGGSLDTVYRPRSQLVQAVHAQARYLYPREFVLDKEHHDQLLRLDESWRGEGSLPEQEAWETV